MPQPFVMTNTDDVPVGTVTNPLYIEGAGNVLPAAMLSGQYKITAAAVAIGSQALTQGVVVKAKSTNAGAVWVGGATVNTTDDGTGNGFKLLAGEGVGISISNISGIYAIGTANDVLYWTGD